MLNPSALIDPVYSICVRGDIKEVVQLVRVSAKMRIKGFIVFSGGHSENHNSARWLSVPSQWIQ
jgi:hypothetical protein